MKRPASAEKTLDRIAAWRKLCPELTLRSTFIVGFPGETEAEFEELLAFLDAAQLDRVGCFAYSPVDGAAANALPEHVSEGLKEERRARFMATQAKISAARLQSKVGKNMKVLVDRIENTWAIARSSADAPEIDGVVKVCDAASLSVGSFAQVTAIRAGGHDITAKLAAQAACPTGRNLHAL
jgi:ribosomal protein S12 methylthiotransferase